MDSTSNVPQQPSPALVELIAERFRVLGEPMRIRLLDALRDSPATVGAAPAGDRRIPAERLQASRRAASQRHGEPQQARRLLALRDSRRGRVRAVRAGMRWHAPSAGRSRRTTTGGSEPMSATECAARGDEEAGAGASRWPLERVLFALAGSMTLLSAALAALVSPWFLLLTAFVGVNQWLVRAPWRVPRLAGAAPPVLVAFGPLPPSGGKLMSTTTAARAAKTTGAADRAPDACRADRPPRALHRDAFPQGAGRVGPASRSCSGSSRRGSRARSRALAGKRAARSRCRPASSSKRTSPGLGSYGLDDGRVLPDRNGRLAGVQVGISPRRSRRCARTVPCAWSLRLRPVCRSLVMATPRSCRPAPRGTPTKWSPPRTN